MEILLGIIIVLLVAVLFFQLRPKSTAQSGDELRVLREEMARVKAESTQKDVALGSLKKELEAEQKEKNEYQGKNKQLFVENNALKADKKNVEENLTEVRKNLVRFESEKEQKEKEFKRATDQLEHARQKLEAEQERVKREDEEKLQMEKEEYDRIWNEHENAVAAKLREICQRPQSAFLLFDNNNLPDGFDSSLKPDGMVRFLEQYIIFDAKKSKDIATYIPDQVKRTVTKIKKSASVADIYSTVFLVVPVEELQVLKKTFYDEDGYTFFVVPIESLEGILAAYKRILDYAKLSEFDPQDRESIINLIAKYDRHISFQNAANIILAREGVDVMGSKEGINKDILTEVENKKQAMRPLKLPEAEVKKLTQNPGLQEKEVKKMVQPKSFVPQQDLDHVSKQLF